MKTILLLAAAALVLAGLGWFLSRPRHLTLGEEENLLRDYFRRTDNEGKDAEPKV